MASKEFKSTYGLSNWETSQKIITQAITSNSATTIDTTALNSFYSIEYSITIVQGSKIRTSKVSVQTDGTSVDSTEYGIVATGGAISGVAITATTSGSNMLLQVTITDATTTIARVRAIKNIMGVIQPYTPSAPIMGTATAGAEQASITFTPPIDNGNSVITSYVATSSPGGITGSSASSPVLVSGLTGSVAYTFTITATNGYGISPTSSVSNSVTPTIIPAKAGYFVGGFGQGANAYKILFSNDTASTLSNFAKFSRYNGKGCANSGTAGYVMGGQQNGGSFSYTTNAEKMPFTTEVSATMSSSYITVNRQAWAANSGTAGYGLGGSTTGGGFETRVYKLLFSNDTFNQLGSSIATYNSGTNTALANSGVKSYYAGGATSNPSNYTSTTYKLLFSNDTFSQNSTQLSVSRGAGAGLSNNGVAGYFAGGLVSSTSANSRRVDKVLFSTDAISSLGNILIRERVNSDGAANSGVAGYVYGDSSSWQPEKFDFNTETSSNILSGVSAQSPAAFANSGIL